jgi:hypothetical protein
MRNRYTCGIAATPGVAHGPTVGDFEMYVYEFVGDLSKFDDPGLVDEDGEVVAHGYRATELLTRALLGYRSLARDDRLEVENLLKHIFDPRGTVFCGRSFLYRWCANERLLERGGRLSHGPALVFTRYASGAAGEERFTKLILRFRADNDRSLVVQCLTYETLAPQADVRVT